MTKISRYIIMFCVLYYALCTSLLKGETMLKFKVGDKIEVKMGKDKGRTGTIEKIYPKKGTALVPGLNVYKKHVKGMPGQKGGIYEIPRPLHFAKISVVCPSCKKASRIGFNMAGKEKVRVCKNCGKEIKEKKK